MNIDEIINVAERIRFGETNVFVVRQMLTEQMTQSQINTLKAATETDSGKFGDVLLIVLTQLM